MWLIRKHSGKEADIAILILINFQYKNLCKWTNGGSVLRTTVDLKYKLKGADNQLQLDVS